MTRLLTVSALVAAVLAPADRPEPAAVPVRTVVELPERRAARASRSRARHRAPVQQVRSTPRPDLLWRIALCESGGNPRARSANGCWFGAFQFDLATWRGVGGVGLPDAAPLAEQRKRAELLYALRGIAPWPGCARKLGLR